MVKKKDDREFEGMIEHQKMVEAVVETVAAAVEAVVETVVAVVDAVVETVVAVVAVMEEVLFHLLR